MTSTMSLTIDQILRAAKLLEQQQQMSLIDPLSFCKLGQNYENRIMQTKMRGSDVVTANAALGLANSTGSSLRSSPFCSQNSSSPNSPQNSQLLPSNMRGGAKSSTSSVAPLLTGRSSSSATNSSSTSVLHSTRQSRTAHNELEKNRRANLRNYLEKLKLVLPADPESTRDTTLSLLTRARNYIRVVKQQKQVLLETKQETLNEIARLKARLEELNLLALVVQAPQITVQQKTEELTPASNPESQVSQLSNLKALQLAKPEPQHVEQQSSMYMEFSPSAKPSNTSLDSFQPTLSALLNFNALHAAFNQATDTAATLNSVITNPSPLVDSNTATLLSSVLGTSNILGLPSLSSANPTNSSLLCSSFHNIDLMNDGLCPSLPLLYPYNSNAC